MPAVVGHVARGVLGERVERRGVGQTHERPERDVDSVGDDDDAQEEVEELPLVEQPAAVGGELSRLLVGQMKAKLHRGCTVVAVVSDRLLRHLRSGRAHLGGRCARNRTVIPIRSPSRWRVRRGNRPVGVEYILDCVVQPLWYSMVSMMMTASRI